MPRHLALTLLVALLAGCALLPAAPDWVTDRPPLPACGVELMTDEGGEDGEARRCLLAAWEAGEEAELITRFTTADGDTTTRYLRVRAGGVIELFVDATLDALGSGQWERWACDSLAPVADDGGTELVFTEQGCRTLP
ncbi:MAG TPA: hypothetical protein VLA76_00335 [Candidatus Angelobacter sp.]|nr:hypothetical protein [Candidatus Angelobacter sp.]